MKHAEISVADLLLDVENPRHPPANNQREAIGLLLDGYGEKILKLAEDIAENGLSPIDEMLVLQNRNGTYSVLEGNRRIASIKLLSTPNLAGGRTIEVNFKKLAARASLPSEIRCAVASSREEAQHWLELRHTGQNDGMGVIPWSAESTQRFRRQKGTHADRGISFIDAIVKAYPKDAHINASAKDVAKEKLTTLGRLVSDPYVRDSLGIAFSDGEMLAHHSAGALRPAVTQILDDLSKSLTVTDLKTKAHRKKYIGKLKDKLPPSDDFLETARPLAAGGPAKRAKPKRPTEVKLSKPPDHLFMGVYVSNLGSKIQAIITELKTLDLDKFPNAASVLLRAVIELSVDQVFDAKGWPNQGYFKTRVKRCLTAVDPKSTDLAYQPVRTGLQDGTSLMAVATMHAWVHNPHYNPVASELRVIAHNYTPFLTALDGLI